MSPTIELMLLEVRESFTMALVAIRVNKLRSILTILGVAVGVFSIIGVMTAMGVLVNSIESGMSALGANTVQIQKYPMFQNGDPSEWAKLRNRKKITYEDAMRLKEAASLARLVGIFTAEEGRVVSTPSGTKTNPNVTLTGRDVEGFTANNWTIGEGRLFSQAELQSAKRVAVIGTDVAKKLFPRIYPIGQTIRIDGREFELVGVAQTNGNMLGGQGDYFAVIPLTTFFNIYGRDRDVAIKVQAPDAATFDDCIEQARSLLRVSRHVAPGDEDDFYIWSNDSVIQQFNDFTKYVRLGIMVISAIALLAAGVGIMNIMLVSVTERTREIGIRKAVGAKRSSILYQFVLEAILISQFGGLLGILLGVAGGNIVAILMKVPPIIPYDWVAIGFLSCITIGMIFGVYPAWKASNLDPIESLRYE